MIRIFQQPFPKEWSLLRGIRMALLSGIIVSVFLWVFEPFGIQQVQLENMNLFILGYGAVTTVVILVLLPLPFLFKDFFKEESWTVGKNIAFFVFNFFFIGIGNWLYTHLLTRLPLMWGSFLFFQFVTVAVALIVAGIFTLLKYSRSLNLNVEEARQIEKEVQDIGRQKAPSEFILRSENEKDEVLKLSDSTLLYIESADNYSKVVYHHDRQIKSVLLRSSLKRTESQINNPMVFRCHRSFLVNLSQVVSVEGNSQGYRLHFDHCQDTIPVARRTGEELHKRLRMLKGGKTVA